MGYILIVDSNNKVLRFDEDKKDQIKNFLISENIIINKDNYFTKKEWETFNQYRHIANSDKTNKEFEEYCRMAKRIGLPQPDRNSKIRPLHEFSKNAVKNNKDEWCMVKNID